MVFFSAKNKAPPENQGSQSHFGFKKNLNSALYYNYCNWDGHTNVVCYKLRGYPPD